MTVTDLYRVRTYAEELYTNAGGTEDALELGLSIWPHLAIVVALTLLAVQGVAMFAPLVDRAAPRRRWICELGVWRWPLAAAVLAATLVVLGVPLLNLVLKAGMEVDVRDGAPRLAWSSARFAASTFPADWRPARWRFAGEYWGTIRLGVGVANLSTVLAIGLAWFARRGDWRGLPALAVTAVGLALPGPVVALGVMWLLNRPTPAMLPWLYDRTLLAPVLAIAARTTPLATMLLWGAFRSVPQDQWDVAATEGASSWNILTRVVLPQRWPAVAIAWLAALAIGMGDLTASILVLPPGEPTFANRIFGLIHAGVHHAEAGLCLGQLALFALIAGLILTLGAWARGGEGPE